MKLKINTDQKIIRHTHNGKTYTDTVKPYNDAFFEIVKGRRKGNLVHLWNIKP